MPASEEAKKTAAKKPAAKKTTAKKEAAPAAKEAVKEVKKVVDEPKPEKKSTTTDFKAPTTEELKKVKTLRIVAIILWVVAIACEVGAFFMLNRGVNNDVVIQTLADGTRQVVSNALVTKEGAINFASRETILLIVHLVIDLACCIVAAQLWKKSNAISPCLAKSAFVRTLWHQLGVIMLLVCFLPIGIVLVAKSKKLNKKYKTILIAALSAVFVAATASNIDYKQPNQEQFDDICKKMSEAAGTNDVYWTKFGYAYHIDPECSHIKGKASVADGGTLLSGTFEQALEANRTNPCADCAGADRAAKLQELGEQFDKAA